MFGRAKLAIDFNRSVPNRRDEQILRKQPVVRFECRPTYDTLVIDSPLRPWMRVEVGNPQWIRSVRKAPLAIFPFALTDTATFFSPGILGDVHDTERRNADD